MIVAVTGGSGFIGTAVRKRLVDLGHTPRALDQSEGMDVRSIEQVYEKLRHAHAVIHLAGVLGTDELFDTPHLAVDVNVKGTLNVLEACRDFGIRYVGITMPDAFPSIYTATKLAATRLATAYHHTHGVPVSHVRAYNAFGPGQAHGPGHPRKIIPAFATEAWSGEPLTIWGDGTQTVDLIYVDDLARMLVDALAFGDDEVFDGGTGYALTVNEVALLIGQLTGAGDAMTYKPMRRGEEPTKIVATGEGWQHLDWRPQFRLSDLARTVDYYEHFSHS